MYDAGEVESLNRLNAASFISASRGTGGGGSGRLGQ